MNMWKSCVDFYETMIPYEGLGFVDIKLKAHYPLDEGALMESIRTVSVNFPAALMTDESAVFIKDNEISKIGEILQIINGETEPLSEKIPGAWSFAESCDCCALCRKWNLCGK